MTMHEIQTKLLGFIKSKKGNLEGLSLRDIGEILKVGKRPQIIAHHLSQLENKGFIRRNNPGSKKFTVMSNPVPEIVYINLYESAQCGPEGLLGDDTVVDKIPLSSKTFGITNADDFFLIKARGRSMEPTIKDGDLVLSRKQPDVNNGSVAVVVHNEMPKIKKVVWSKNGERVSYSLISLNPDYTKEDVFEEDNLGVVGLVKGVISFTNS